MILKPKYEDIGNISKIFLLQNKIKSLTSNFSIKKLENGNYRFWGGKEKIFNLSNNLKQKIEDESLEFFILNFFSLFDFVDLEQEKELKSFENCPRLEKIVSTDSYFASIFFQIEGKIIEFGNIDFDTKKVEDYLIKYFGSYENIDMKKFEIVVAGYGENYIMSYNAILSWRVNMKNYFN